MAVRNTSTGGVLEAMIVPALLFGGYEVSKQVQVGCRPGGGVHNVDAIARKDASVILVSLKWQQTSGTAEQKVPFEVMCLADAVKAGHANKAILVLGGDAAPITGNPIKPFKTDLRVARSTALEFLSFEDTFRRLARN